MKNALLLTLLSLIYSVSSLAFELVVIQGLSKEKQTFVTRNDTNIKTKSEVFKGKKVTFTSENVSVIARAIKTTNEFIQWEILNDYTDVPFKRGQIVTMYDTTEYLWALTPETIKRKYVKDNLYKPRRSIETQLSFTRTLSESVTDTPAQNVDRGGVQFDATFRKEFNINYAIAYGFSYAREVINLPEASLINTRFLGTIEGRYYFDPMEDFYNAQIGLGLGFGFGQSRTQNTGQTTFGSAVLMPATKISLMIPINKEYDMEFLGAFESLRLDESNSEAEDQTTNLTNTKFGVMFRKHL
ncbi:MAG: hypothetical protein ACJAS4_003500 [Bacteriovoracaceae bacterium]|jgi:hypothetical protein